MNARPLDDTRTRCPVCCGLVNMKPGHRVLSCTVIITTPIVTGKAAPATREYSHSFGFDDVADAFEQVGVAKEPA